MTTRTRNGPGRPGGGDGVSALPAVNLGVPELLVVVPILAAVAVPLLVIVLLVGGEQAAALTSAVQARVASRGRCVG